VIFYRHYSFSNPVFILRRTTCQDFGAKSIYLNTEKLQELNILLTAMHFCIGLVVIFWKLPNAAWNILEFQKLIKENLQSFTFIRRKFSKLA
jgi:hypothetical protein